MDLEKYIKVKYGQSKFWFVDEFEAFSNQDRIRNIQDIRYYLDGKHQILARPNFNYNGELVNPRKIVIQLAKTIVNFKTQYLLKNPVTMTGDEKMVEQFMKVNRLGRFDDKNEKILSRLVKHGQAYEYLFINKKGFIDSKIIDGDNGTPIYNRNNELIGFIEHYVYDGITYYTVYSDKNVEEYSNDGSEFKLVDSHINVTGLPIVYKTENDLDSVSGRSELNDYINILDNMEDVLSKYVDSMYKFMNPIPVAIGQQLTSSIPSEIVGGGLNLDDGADFKLVSNQLDSKSFQTVYDKLNQTLLDVSSTPAVSMNKTDISNLSEVSIKLLFSLADTSAGEYENYLMEGFYERYARIIQILKLKGINISDEQFVTLDFSFIYNTPSNNKEILDNMKTQFDMGAISLDTILENSPYVKDPILEKTRIEVQNDVPSREQVIGIQVEEVV